MPRVRIVMLVALLAAVARGDIIWLANGKALEGTAEQVGDKIRVIERDGKGEYELSTAIVVRVDQGIWLEDLEPGARAQAQRAMQVPTIAEPAKALPGEDALRRRGISWRKLMQGSGQQKSQKMYSVLVGCIGMVFFMILSLVAFIITVIDAFRRHMVAGLVVLFVPLAVFVYVVKCYSGQKGRMILALLSPVLWGVVVWYMLRG